jgi:hypothetical protein
MQIEHVGFGVIGTSSNVVVERVRTDGDLHAT